MNVRLISHASVLIKTLDVVVLTDPWLFGTAFNDSWCLSNKPSEFNLDEVTHLWISHEHSDHFHPPTLKSFPQEFKNRVKVLFQDNYSDRIPNALEEFGYNDIFRMKHRKKLYLGNTLFYCYQSGIMDSSLAIGEKEEIILNLNDCQFYKSDAKLVLKDLGHVDTLLNQFSYATNSGKTDYHTRLPREAFEILDRMVSNHRDLKAKVTMPFASFIRFCSTENQFMNQYMNTVYDVKVRFEKDGLECKSFELPDKVPMELTEPCSVKVEHIWFNFSELCRKLYLNYPSWILWFFRSMTVYIPDIGKSVKFSLKHRSFHIPKSPRNKHDLVINSQALNYSFAHLWGNQTLSISGRFTIHSNFNRWLACRLLFAFNNAEIRFDIRTLKWVMSRWRGLLWQVINQFRFIKY